MTTIETRIATNNSKVDTANETSTATTYTTKAAKNGAINFYSVETGKRVKEADIVAEAIENDGTFYAASVHGYGVDHFCSKEFASPITAYKWICRMARKSNTYADGDACITVGFCGELIYTQKHSVNEIKNAELRAYVEAEMAEQIAEDDNNEREDLIYAQMHDNNLTREQAEQITDYLRANRKNYNAEIAATAKAMLDNYKKINNPETATVNVEINNAAEHTPATVEETADNTVEAASVEEKAEVIIPIVDYRTLLTWAEKVSNGQHDTAIQIVTHIKKWFNAETDKKTVIEVIKAGDLNGFRNFLCQFNFAVKDDGGCIHKLYRYDNGECVLAEIPTSEYAKYSVEETEAELPKGDITVESGSEAWAIVGKYFPKGNLEFYRAGKGFNNEDTFCYTLDEIIYVHVTCTPDNKRVKCIEIVNTYEESESERNILTVNIAPPVKAEETAIEEPDGYNPDVFNLLPNLEDLNDVDGEFDGDAAEYTDRNDRYNRGEKIAEGLTAKLRAFDPTVEVTFAIDDDEDTYYLSYDDIARTPFTATGVEASFHAMKQSEAKPEIPTADDLTDREKFLQASKVVITVPGRHLGEDRFATKWVTLCPYKTISKATAGNILATFGLTTDAYLAEKAKWVADEIKRGSRQFAIDCQAEFLRDKTARDSKASVEPLPVFIPAEDSDDDELIDTPELTPTDDFVAKLAELKAKQDAAKTAELAAKKVYDEASDKYEECRAATQDFLDAHAEKLTEKIKAIELESYISLVRDNGKERCDVFRTDELYVDAFNAFGEMFLVRYMGNKLGNYDTPAQVEAVIERLKAATERGDREFTFPTVEDLNTPPTEPTIAEEAPAKFVAGQCYHNMDWATFERGGKVYKVTKRTAKYVYIATYSEQRGEWYEGGRYRIKENSSGEYVEYWDGERICAKFNGEQITKPAIDRTQIEDSLTRAMNIALEHYKGFCHIGNLTKAEHELKLYEICRKAMTELWKEEAA